MANAVIIDFDKIFKNENYKEYLQRFKEIPKKMLIDSCTHLLTFTNENTKLDIHRKLLSDWFCAENNSLANEIYQRIIDFIKTGFEDTVIINPRTSLKLFEKILMTESDSPDISNKDFEILLFKIYLAFNQELNENDKLVVNTANNIKEYPELINLSIGYSLPTFDISNYNLFAVFVCQIVKSIMLFEFLDKRVDSQKLLIDFYKKFEVKDYKEFLSRLLPVSFQIMKANKEGYLDIVVPKDLNFKRNTNFLDKLTVNQNNIEDNDVDYLILRTNPLFKISDDRYRVIFHLFALEKNFNGIYFLLKELNDIKPKTEKINLRQIITFDFSEKYILYSLIERTYPKRYLKLPGNKMKTPGAIDYYIRNGNKIFIFESKDILIKAKTKESYNYKLYLEALMDKLYFEQHKNKVSPKAVMQLSNFTKTILKGEFKEDSKYNPKSAKIYPIIILHNRQLDIIGLNNLVNIWYKKEIELMKKDSIETKNIVLPTIMHIDTLILYHDQLASGKLKLEEILEDYQNWINEDRLKNKKFKNENEFQNSLNDTLSSFNMYMRSKYTWRIPSIFKEKGISLLT